MNDKEYNQFCNYLSERAELKVQEMIEAGMRGRPGLLIRNFKSEENIYKELSKLLGISIVPNCSKDHTKLSLKKRLIGLLICLYFSLDWRVGQAPPRALPTRQVS